MNALSRWMCGCTKDGSTRGGCEEEVEEEEDESCGVIEEIVPCGESYE